MESLKVFLTSYLLFVAKKCFVNAIPRPQAAATVCVTCVVPCPTCEGQWGEWGPWSACTFQYGVWGMSRERVCVGSNCKGARDEAIQCAPPTTTTTLMPPVWGEWCPWGTCSASCGGGVQSRSRQCIRVAGQTLNCEGPATEQRSCNPQPCCEWSQWSSWSSCSVTCGEGISIRSRQCSCSEGCQGESLQQQVCSGPPCQPACDPTPGCTTCCSITVNCALCTPGQPCASTCGSSADPTIGTGAIPVINNSVPTIGTGAIPVINNSVPTIGSGAAPVGDNSVPIINDGTLPNIGGDIPVIGSGNIPHITARSVDGFVNLPDVGGKSRADDLVPHIDSKNQVSYVGSNLQVPYIGYTTEVPRTGSTGFVAHINSETSGYSNLPKIGEGASNRLSVPYYRDIIRKRET